MSKVSRREFLKLGLATGAGFLLSPVAQKLRAFAAAAPAPTRASFWIKATGTDVRCQLCPRQCLIKQGGRGFCEDRENRDGTLYTMVYGNPCAAHVDPIEKKPLYHVLPGTRTFSFATAGCNFECRYCQNWQISQARPEQTENIDLPPQRAVAQALAQKLPSVSATYTEPAVFYEYMHDTFRLAREKGLATLYHSNGFINPEPLKELCKYLTAANIDLKAFDQDTYARMSQGRLEPVLETLKTLK
ncbi:MAG TPA: radical SAM protein, partial [Candidatus Edwardsbacteria bacterium]|nr:radical SAM protein [Candidatus Edwardsbacteria bacterium]